MPRVALIVDDSASISCSVGSGAPHGSHFLGAIRAHTREKAIQRQKAPKPRADGR